MKWNSASAIWIPASLILDLGVEIRNLAQEEAEAEQSEQEEAVATSESDAKNGERTYGGRHRSIAAISWRQRQGER